MLMNNRFDLYSRINRAPDEGGGSGSGAAAAPAGGAGGQTIISQAAAAPAAAAQVGVKSWRESTLTGDYATDPVFKNFENGEDLLRSYKHAQSMIGTPPDQLARKPGVDATQQDWDKYHEFNGRPKLSKDYTAPKLPDGKEYNKEAMAQFQEWSHKAGLNNDQFQKIVGSYKDAQEALAQKETLEYNQKVEETDSLMKKEWGSAYEQTRTDINRAFNAYGEEGLKAELEDKGMGASPKMLRFLAKIGKGLAESNALGSTGGGNPDGRVMGATEAQTAIRELQGDKTFMDAYKKGDPSAQARMTRLYGFAYPEKK